MGLRDKFKKSLDSTEKEEEYSNSREDFGNFNHLANLIDSGESEVILDDDITLSTGEEEKFLEGIKLDVDDLIIDGRGHIIDACGKTRIFKVRGKNVTLKNIKFKNGLNDEGGAIYVDNFARLEIIDCVFSDNVSKIKGGAIANFAEVRLEGVDFSENLSNSIGGAVFNEVIGDISLLNCSFKDNVSKEGGGALINFGKLVFDGVAFDNNSSRDSTGGALNNQIEGDASLVDCSFSANVSHGGGAVYNKGKIIVKGALFEKNSTEGDGGAINNNGNSADLSLNESKLIENTSKGGGGAIVNWGSSVIKNSEFKDNSTLNNGNDINFQNGSLKLSNVKFHDLKETSIFSADDDLVEMENCEFMERDYDKILKESSERNFKFLDLLVQSGKKEILLDSDIVLSEGEENKYGEGIKLEANDLVIDGNGYSIDAANKARIFIVNGNVTLKNITLKNGFSKGDYAGAIYHKNNSNLIIENANFINNTAEVEGGAIVNFGDILLKESNFEKCHSADRGGAIFNNSNGLLTITRAKFIENTSKQDGGAITNFGKIIIDDGDFAKNSSREGYGGALYNKSKGDISLLNCSFCANLSKKGGAAIQNNGKVIVKESIFERNRTGTEGAAINNNSNSSSLKIDECKFIENKSKTGGGAIVNWGNSIINNSEFKYNASSKDGNDIDVENGSLELSNVKFNGIQDEAIFSVDDVSLKLESCEFIESNDGPHVRNFKYLDELIDSGENSIVLDSDIMVDDDEEKIYKEGIKLDIDNLVIDGDGHSINAKSLTRIFYVLGKDILLKNLIFENGLNDDGAAIYNNESAILVIKNCNFADNLAKSSGGAIFNNGKITLDGVNFTNNTADEDSGGAINNQDGEIFLIRCYFSDNSSNEEGGAIFNWGEIGLEDVNFTKNTSSNNGGAINNQIGGKAILNNCSFSENSAEEGGAIYTARDEEVELNSCTFKDNGPDDKSSLV